MIIGVCGLTGTGASAVTDYLSGFDEICVMDDFEFTICHSPDGLEDLDYQVNKHCSKYTASHVALFRFQRCAYNYLIRLIKNKQKKEQVKIITDVFVDRITQVKWRGFGIADLQLYKNHITMLPFLYSMNFLKKCKIKLNKDWKYYPSHTMRLSILPEYFDQIAKEYISNVINILTDDSEKTIVIDQPFAGNCPENSFKFFENPRAIVVDRDPRDLYVFTKEFYHKIGAVYQVPTDSVENFIAYYKNMRNVDRNETDNILRINFEEMVYESERTFGRICDFCGITSTSNGCRFDPLKSVNNTQVFKKYPQYREDINRIEFELKEYLFPFSKYPNKTNTGEMFDPQV